jgi:DNA-binding NtrC family response regulator
MAQRRLLFVDDEQNILNAIKRLLRREGYELHTASSGEEGLELLARLPCGVVFFDQRMTGMTGVEFLAEVMDLYPGTVRVILSGFSDADKATEAEARGDVYRFMRKPWDDAALKSLIAECFELHEQSTRTAGESRPTDDTDQDG